MQYLTYQYNVMTLYNKYVRNGIATKLMMYNVGVGVAIPPAAPGTSVEQLKVGGASIK
jgi:hypothetical protein